MKVVLLLSGGLDSTVLLYLLRDWNHEVLPIAFDYGQKHVKELACAVEHGAKVVSIGGLELASSLTDDSPVPDGHYADPVMTQTVVPNRNMILLSLAGGYAISNQADAICYAVHAGDHPIYPDCRREFVDAFWVAFREGNYDVPKLLTPFIALNKTDIVKMGQEVDVPFERTWSCYKGGEVHCGTCGTCYERREAFQLAGVDDPTVYA